MRKIRQKIINACLHLILISYALVVIYPLYVMVITSFKTTREIFFNPFGLPANFSLESYIKVWNIAKFNIYFKNSVLVTCSSVLIILLFASLAAYALGRYAFRGNTTIYLFFLSGLMLPVRLSILPLFLLLRDLHLLDTYYSLILTYSASGMPFSVFVLTGFIRTLPKELEYAARLDGCTEFQIFYRIMVPLIRPALAIVAIFNFIPLWNDFFFPLVFIRNEALKTIPLGMTIFFGQYETEWSLLFAGLTLATVPMLIVYLFMSKQFIRGLIAGAIK